LIKLKVKNDCGSEGQQQFNQSTEARQLQSLHSLVLRVLSSKSQQLKYSVSLGQPCKLLKHFQPLGTVVTGVTGEECTTLESVTEQRLEKINRGGVESGVVISQVHG
jgi:hypothetical protein